MKLYFAPGACSLSPHIALREAGLPFEPVQVNLATKKTKSGDDYWAVNPKGSVPALQLDDGRVLTEGPAVVQYIADQKPDSNLAPAPGTFERYQLQEWLNFISAEIHKTFSGFFSPSLTDERRQQLRDMITKKLDFLDRKIAGKNYLLGDDFTVADGYLFVMMTWMPMAELEVARWPNIAAHYERVKTRPAVAAALQAERAAQAASA